MMQFKKLLFVSILSTICVLCGYGQDQRVIIDKLYSDTMLLRDPFNTNRADTFYLNRIHKIENLILDKGFQIIPDNIAFGRLIEVNADYDSGPGTTDYKKIVRFLYSREGVFSPLIDSTSGSIINTEQIQRIKSIIENPINFNWSECGTYIPSYVILLFNQANSIEFALSIGCDFLQMDLYPNDLRTKFGGLEPNAQSKFYQIIEEIQQKNTSE